jgi:hypothetical protein
MKSNNRLSSNGRERWRTDSRLLAELVADAGQRAVREAIADHHRAGNPVAIWRDGQIVLLYPDGSTRPAEETTASESTG